jgi:hypothetical protein
MKNRINTYLAALIITVAGALAVWIIVHLATSKTPIIKNDSEAKYSALKESILNPD